MPTEKLLFVQLCPKVHSNHARILSVRKIYVTSAHPSSLGITLHILIGDIQIAMDYARIAKASRANCESGLGGMLFKSRKANTSPISGRKSSEIIDKRVASEKISYNRKSVAAMTW